MSAMTEPAAPRSPWLAVAAVFVLVLAAQLWLVAVAGTDIPLLDQWDVEGRWIYPRWLSGEFQAADWIYAGNENRMFWTHGLDLLLLTLNGQWDPLVQLCANAGLRAAVAAGLVALVVRTWPVGGRTGTVLIVGLAFLPHLAWHNALWAIESHAYFALGFSLLTLALLEPAERSPGRTAAGLLAGGAALVSMSPAALALLALPVLAALRALESRRVDLPALGRQNWPVVLLLGLAWLLRVHVPMHDVLRAGSAGQFLAAAGRMLAWPHAGEPLAALAMNAPLALVVGGRLAGWRRAAPGEDRILLLGFWAVAVALAGGLMRGGSPELTVGVPSRYVDFLVLLPLANLWCAAVLAGHAAARWRSAARLLAGAWACFLVIGWVGLSAEVMRGIILPRARDTLAPVRLMQEFQRTDDAAVFAGQPRLLVPHPNPDAMRAVLRDPRLRGVLPPSLQPDQPMGPLSRGVRRLLGR